MSSDVESSEVITSKKDETASSDKPTKKGKNVRHRKRKHLNAIREQMEFYFGDANLSKDRFIMQLLKKDPFVPLDVFLSFNKMKKLTSSVDEIAMSLSNSEVLELDSELKRVKRKAELPENRDVDSKTLYVESLPPSANHDWVKKVFSRFGTVVYVSLPKFTKSRKIKEFGFVEFEQEASIEKALKAFKEFGGALSVETADPSALQSVTSFIKDKQESENKEEEPKENAKKRKKESDEDEPSPKRAKSATDTDTRNDSQSELETDEDGKKRRVRRRKKKSKQSDPNMAEGEADFFELKILPKKDWKRLRNKYLNLQREKVAEMKRQAWKAANPGGSRGSNREVKEPTTSSSSKMENLNMNFYGASQEDNDENASSQANDETSKKEKKNPALEKPPLFKLEPGLIVAVKFLEPCVTVKEFKADMKQYEAVKYVDVKEGALEAFLRFETAASALDFIKQVNSAEYNCRLLTGEPESNYWSKIMKDREMKFNKKVKLPLKRGRERVAKVASKHIRFGDDDEN